METQVVMKRVYEPAEASDGYRVLVDRLWPQGLSKERVDYQLWAKDLAPSPQLRQWFHDDRQGRWDEFVRRYTAELQANPAFAQFVANIRQYPKVTLLYASKDEAHNQADVLLELIQKKLKEA